MIPHNRASFSVFDQVIFFFFILFLQKQQILYYNQQRLSPQMQKLFSLSFRRIANRINQQDLNALNVAQALANSKIPPSGGGFLYRLPRDQLKHILNIPCPINNLQDPSSPSIIASSKALRHNTRINQEKTCIKCPFKEKCPSAKQAFTGSLENTPKDLLIFWSGLANLKESQYVFYRHWVSAYKLGDNIIAELNDLSQGGKEIEEYEILRQQVLKQNQEKFKSENQQKQQNQPKLQKQTKPKQTKNVKKQQKKTKQALQIQEQANQDDVDKEKLGRDFSFDQAEQFQPQSKASKDHHTKKQEQFQPKADKAFKNQKRYKFIEKNENTKQNSSYQKPQYNNFQRRQYQQTDERGGYEGKSQKFGYKKDQANYNNNDENSYQRPNKFQNKKDYYNKPDKRYNREQQFQRKPRFQNRRNDFDSGNNNNSDYSNRYQGKKFDSNYQKPRQFSQRQYEQRRPNRQYQKNEDWRGQKKYQGQSNQPQAQREQKKVKPSPFISKWNTQETFNYQENKTNREFKQTKNRVTEEPNTFDYRKQAQQQKVQQRPKIRIIEAENISESAQGEGRVGRNVKRRSRTATNKPDIQTTTE